MTSLPKTRVLPVPGNSRGIYPSGNSSGETSDFFRRRGSSPDALRADAAPHVSQRVHVLKFGGTSVGDAAAISRVVEIIRSTSRNCGVVVVVSAMNGVTNQLLEAAVSAERGDHAQVAAIFENLRKRHASAASVLIQSPAERERLSRLMQELFQEGDRLCQGTILLRELTLRVRDSIASLGERLAAPLLAAALRESGVASEPIEASRVIVTNSNHGGADPWMDLTSERCETCLRPLLQQGVVPVVTGFIGATSEGVLTTLGRGGSDYSASILAAALGCDEVVLWTDVDGMLTSDPRFVSGARTIPEISYREAADLAYFGAKVLHPKTLRAISQSGMPLWIRNTFAPERGGTKITPSGPARSRGVKAVTAVGSVSLITFGGKGILGVPDVLGRAFAATAMVRAEILLISHSSSQNDICLVVPSEHAQRTVQALRREFALDLAGEEAEHISLDQNIAIVTVVGQDMRGISGIVGRAFGALGRQHVNVVAIAQGTSDCNLSFVVAEKDVQSALVSIHREFRLGSRHRAASARSKGGAFFAQAAANA
ncbi:MAG TPA: aspartate kinase [Verrucomicrobiae bacterium]|nr:aspartate kinase [Verrucomicrobiae bacterium]